MLDIKCLFSINWQTEWLVQKYYDPSGVIQRLKFLCVSDKKKDKRALKALKNAIANVFFNKDFQRRSVECLGYHLNEWQVAAESADGAAISEPWVRNVHILRVILLSLLLG